MNFNVFPVLDGHFLLRTQLSNVTFLTEIVARILRNTRQFTLLMISLILKSGILN